MLLVGLTGNIGSGKSTVAQFLSEHGATIIDADVLARRAVEPGTAAYRAIAERWGTSILSPDGSGIDRGGPPSSMPRASAAIASWCATFPSSSRDA